MCTTVRWHLVGDESSILKRNFDGLAHVQSGGDLQNLTARRHERDASPQRLCC